MKRRQFFHLITVSAPFFLGGCAALRDHLCRSCFPPFETKKIGPTPTEDIGDMAETQTPGPRVHYQMDELNDEQMHGERAKSVFFDRDFSDDIYFTGERFEMVKRLALKFSLVQKYVGAGNFNLVGMDDFLRYSEMVPGIEALTRHEKRFLEELFYFDAKKYGFTGDKVFHNLTDGIKKRDTLKIPYSGHFLKKGESLALYEKVKQDVGDTLILTSGLRAIAKQYHLFLVKAIETKGNMSKASRSLAPPGYSFHGRGDFDVGKIGHGLRNFTDDFASTDEFKRLSDLGYVNIRYTQSNTLGVRFEPWHIKVHS